MEPPSAPVAADAPGPASSLVLLRTVLSGADASAQQQKLQQQQAASGAADDGDTSVDQRTFELPVQPRWLRCTRGDASIEVWALRAYSTEDTRLHADDTKARKQHGSGYTPSLPMLPWTLRPEVVSATGWHCLLPSAPIVVPESQESVTLPLSCPTTDALFVTRRLLFRGRYSRLPVALLGSAYSPEQSGDVLSTTALRGHYQQRRRSARTAQSIVDAEYVPRCFQSLLPLYPPSFLFPSLLLTPTSASSVGNLLHTRLIGDASECSQASHALLELEERLRQFCGDVNATTVQLPIRMTDDDTASLTALAQTCRGRLRSLDECTRIVAVNDATGALQRLTVQLSFILAATCSASAAAPSEYAGFESLRAFCRRLTSPLPLSLFRVLASVLNLLVSSSPLLAYTMSLGGCGWLWLLSWLNPQHASSTLRLHVNVALHLVNTLLQCPSAIDVLLHQHLLPDMPDAASALVPLQRMLTLHPTASTDTPGSERLPLQSLHRYISDKIALRGHMAQLAADEQTRATTAQQPGAAAPEHASTADRRVESHLLRIISLLQSVVEQHDAERIRQLSACFLQYARHFQLLQSLQQLLARRMTGASEILAASQRPLGLFRRIVRPLLMLGFFGSHTSAQHVVYAGCEERAAHELQWQMRELLQRKDDADDNSAPDDELAKQEVQSLLHFIEGRVVALQLLLQCHALDVDLRVAAWTFLAAFIQHPYGLDGVACVLREAQSAVIAQQQLPGSQQNGVVTPMTSIHRMFLIAFHERDRHAVSLQRPAISVLHTLLHSTHAESLFFPARGRMSLPSKDHLVWLLDHLRQQPGWSGGGLVDVEASACVHSVGAIEAWFVGQQAQAADVFPVDTFCEGLSFVLRTTLHDAGLYDDTPALLRTLQCAHWLLEGEPSSAVSASAAQSVDMPPLVKNALKKAQQCMGIQAARRRIVEMLFQHTEAHQDNHVHPAVPHLLRLLTAAFVEPEVHDSVPDLPFTTVTLQAMDVSAAGLDVLLRVLHASLKLLGAHPTAQPGANNTDPPLPLPLCQLRSLHESLWSVHHILSSHRLFFHHFLGAPQTDSDVSSLMVPSTPRASVLGFMPRLRHNLHRCLALTAWHLCDPSVHHKSPAMHAALYGDGILPPLAVPTPEGALRWWKEQLFPAQTSAWPASLRFLLDVLPAPWERDATHTRVPQRTEFELHEKKHLWRAVLDELEAGPRDLRLPPAKQPAALSAMLQPDSPLMASNNATLREMLARFVASAAECILPEMATRILRPFVDQLAASVRGVRVGLDTIKHQAGISNGSAHAAEISPAHEAAHRQLLLLHAMLHFPRVRWLLNDLSVISTLQPLLMLSIPCASLSIVRPGAATTNESAAVQEALAFQVLALECVHLIVDSSALPSTSRESRGIVDLPAEFVVRLMEDHLMPCVLHGHPTLALTAGRILLSCAQSAESGAELLAFFANSFNCAPLIGSSWGKLHGLPSNVQTGTPLLLWRTTRVEQCEIVARMQPAGRLPGEVELELWGQVTLLLKLLATHGLADLPSCSPPSAGATDLTWRLALRASHPGMGGLMRALAWPMRTQNMLATEHALIDQWAQGRWTPPSPPAGHALVRILARLQQALSAAQGKVSDERARRVSALLSAQAAGVRALMERCHLCSALGVEKNASREPPPPSNIGDKYAAAFKLQSTAVLSGDSNANAHVEYALSPMLAHAASHT